MSQFFGSLGRGFRGKKPEKTKPSPLPSASGNSGNGGASGNGGNGGGGYNPPSGNLMPGSPSGQRITQKPLFLCKPFVTSQLVKGSFSTIVVLPRYVDQGEWLALNLFEFFDMLNKFYGVVQEFCTPQACPSMSAGPGLDYSWLDANKKPLRLPATTYIEYVLQWISNRINDESIFPTKANPSTTTAVNAPSSSVSSSPAGAAGTAGQTWIGKEGGFPPNFYVTCKAIYKQMFRVFAHIYHTHFAKIVHMSLEAHFNSFFAHFIHFARAFELLERRDIEPLRPLIDSFEEQGLFKDNERSREQ
ncbi:Mob1/phocein [Tuber borchii]|uniref:Mob1/phocein n=1 Tax=Tuber borchii TaxID=42251 RepID=A0A2T6ZC24_TUBBO|nr:Mob1/phocein [Tuber borchii]